MSLNIKSFLGEYIKPNALKLGGEVAIDSVVGPPVIPSTAKLIIPDVESILSYILEIIDEEPSPTASVWQNFTTNNVFEVSQIDPELPQLVYNVGFYSENINTENNLISIGYSGVLNFAAFADDIEYSGTNYTFKGDWNDGDIDGNVDFDIQSDLFISYSWRETEGGDYEMAFYTRSSMPKALLTFDCIVSNTGEMLNIHTTYLVMLEMMADVKLVYPSED